MAVTLYHELSPETVDKVLAEGIKKDKSGTKRNSSIEKLDTFLDTHIPDEVKTLGLSRRSVVYAFMASGDKIVDIVTGDEVAVEDYIKDNQMSLLKLKVEPEVCYVSDLDLYDTLRRAMEQDEQDSTREHLADRYWKRVIPLKDYEPGTIARPEVMIATDIEPRDIEVIVKHR